MAFFSNLLTVWATLNFSVTTYPGHLRKVYGWPREITATATLSKRWLTRHIAMLRIALVLTNKTRAVVRLKLRSSALFHCAGCCPLTKADHLWRPAQCVWWPQVFPHPAGKCLLGQAQITALSAQHRPALKSPSLLLVHQRRHVATARVAELPMVCMHPWLVRWRRDLWCCLESLAIFAGSAEECWWAKTGDASSFIFWTTHKSSTRNRVLLGVDQHLQKTKRKWRIKNNGSETIFEMLLVWSTKSLQ